jgi:hypothetical protein
MTTVGQWHAANIAMERATVQENAHHRRRKTSQCKRIPDCRQPLPYLGYGRVAGDLPRNAPTLRQSHCQGFRLTVPDLSLRLKPFKCSSNGFVHRDFGSISQFTGGPGAVQVLTRRHHRNGTGRYFRSRAVQVLVLKSLPCRNQLGCGQRNLPGFGSPGNALPLPDYGSC